LLGDVAAPLPSTCAGRAINVVTAPVAARKLRREIVPGRGSLSEDLVFILCLHCPRPVGLMLRLQVIWAWRLPQGMPSKAFFGQGRFKHRGGDGSSPHPAPAHENRDGPSPPLFLYYNIPNCSRAAMKFLTVCSALPRLVRSPLFLPFKDSRNLDLFRISDFCLSSALAAAPPLCAFPNRSSSSPSSRKFNFSCSRRAVPA
jgi:hypothetical protein